MNRTGFIYKLVSSDVEIKECYVGSTKNLKVRKWAHKKDCTNENLKGYNYYVYQFIRQNGGWENWDMVLLETVSYNTKYELHSRERYWIEELQAKLNKIIPTRTIEEYQQLPEYKQYKKEYRNKPEKKNERISRRISAKTRGKKKKKKNTKENIVKKKRKNIVNSVILIYHQI